MVTRKSRTGGFTLVELSIVLVIIGLLIGGILVAQSMISTSKITATAAQIQQFDAGVMNFKTKYNYLPGDAPAFGGDGDGMIDRTSLNGGDNSVNCHETELVTFWSSMFPNEYSPTGSTSLAIPVTDGSTKNVPASKMGAKGAFVIASALSDGTAHVNTSGIKNYYAVLGNSFKNQTTAPAACFWITGNTTWASTPVESLALDQKMDDGLANDGNIISGRMNDLGGAAGAIDSTATATCSSGATYAVANSGYECTPLIRIGAQAGDPQ